jgi:hypothetical protein
LCCFIWGELAFASWSARSSLPIPRPTAARTLDSTRSTFTSRREPMGHKLGVDAAGKPNRSAQMAKEA